MKWFKRLDEFPLVAGILALGMFAVLITSPYDYLKLIENIRALAFWPTLVCLFALLFFIKDAVGAVISFFRKEVLLALLWAALGSLLVCMIPYLFNYTIFVASYVPLFFLGGVYLSAILLAGIGFSFKRALFGHLPEPRSPRRREVRRSVKIETATETKPHSLQPDSESDSIYSRPIPKSMHIYAY